jgi:hypothetical protein
MIYLHFLRLKVVLHLPYYWFSVLLLFLFAFGFSNLIAVTDSLLQRPAGRLHRWFALRIRFGCSGRG